jgi:hypothetical protein
MLQLSEVSMNTAVRRCVAILSVLLLVQILPTFSQNDFICGTSGTHALWQFRGEYLPGHGVIKALVVYIQFPDDSTSSGSWPSGQLPGGYVGIIAPTNSASYPAWTLSDYYRKMSNGTETTGLNLIGDVYSALVWVPNSMQSYIDSAKNYGDVNRDVLAWLVANTSINFANYDNWRFDSEYNHTNTPNGKVDMIILFYRYIPLQLKIDRYGSSYGDFSGVAQLGEGQARQPNVMTNNYNSSGQRAYISLQRLTSGNASGITISRSWIDFSVVAHEFGHYLFGSMHHLGSGIMGQVFKPAMSSLERQQLGYMSISEATGGVVLVPDFLTANVAYRVPISGSRQYFLVENHQKLSIYDAVGGKTDGDPQGRGLYIFHCTGGLNTEVECADGRWNWKLDCRCHNPFSERPQDSVSTWLQLDANPDHGTNEIEQHVSWRDGACPATIDNYTGDEKGDNEDAFRVGHRQLFSPFTNPNSNTTAGAYTGIQIELLGEINGIDSVRVSTFPPSTPPMLLSPGDKSKRGDLLS